MKKIHRNTVVLTDSVLFRDIVGCDVWTDSTRTSRGFTGEYFPNKSFEGNPAAVRCDSVISFDWGGGSPDASIPVDGFSVRWTGWVAPADSKRNLKLSVGGDDGYRVYVNGKVVAGDWGNHSYPDGDTASGRCRTGVESAYRVFLTIYPTRKLILR